MDETELLFTEVYGCDRLWLYLNKNTRFSKDKAIMVKDALQRRISGEPIQYILGKSYFCGLAFKVNKDVLIPRPETEILVEAALKLCPVSASRGQQARILDLGTGSGCIAVTLAKHFPYAQIEAVDISEAALKIAEENARLNKVKVNFYRSDLFGGLCPKPYTLIVSNPPYIRSKDIGNLEPEVKMEPVSAYDGGSDGLNFYRRIADISPGYLRKGGFLIMELGYRQSAWVKNILKKTGNFEIIEIIKDYNNIDRVIVAKKITNHKFQTANKLQYQMTKVSN